MDEIVLKGIPAAPGIAIGRTLILDKQEFRVAPRAIMEKEIPIEIARFEEALIRTREEILGIQKKINQEMDGKHSQIFDAHLLVLEDRTMIEEVIKRIRSEKLSAEYVFSEVMKKYAKVFADIEDEYLRERFADINDISRRVLKNLMDETKLHEIKDVQGPLIIVSHDLSPSDTASMYNKNIIGFATDIGGKTSHTAIMAKSLGVPAVVGLKEVTLQVRNQDEVILDGRKGLVIVHPTPETVKAYQEAQIRMTAFKDRFQDVKDLPAETLDGKRVRILANLELPEEIPTILRHGANGIGLYRTEYFYMNRVDLPSEEEQFEEYKYVARALAPNEVTIRSLDLGGDKFISSLQIPREMYPFLGWRAIRFCFESPEIFKTQLRAILRASAYGKIRLMYPMVSGLAELKKANGFLNEVKEELKKEKIRFDEAMPVGVMVEVPSAAVTADLLAKEADFFSIGTNDLIQYTLAVDRVNEKTAEFYDPGHPAVLRLIKNTIDVAKAANIPVGLCGEISSEPAWALLLLGMGLEEFSMSPLSMLQIRKLVRSVRFEDAAKVAEEALRLSTGKEVEAFSREALEKLAPEVITAEDKE